MALLAWFELGGVACSGILFWVGSVVVESKVFEVLAVTDPPSQFNQGQLWVLPSCMLA